MKSEKVGKLELLYQKIQDKWQKESISCEITFGHNEEGQMYVTVDAVSIHSVPLIKVFAGTTFDDAVDKAFKWLESV